MSFAVIRAGSDNEDDAEAFGPFASRESAERFADDFGYWVNPGYVYLAVEMYPVRDGRRQIRDEKQAEGAS